MNNSDYYEKQMPAQSPALTAQTAENLVALGGTVRQRRKAMRISAVAAAESAGISRVTLHRIEKGEPSVTIGAYLAVLGVLGLIAEVAPAKDATASATPSRAGWIPARVRIADYPKLRNWPGKCTARRN